MKDVILNKQLQGLFLSGTFGIEKEGQRVLKNGEITKTRHPKSLGNRLNHPYIQTDFAETQLELVTPTVENEQEALRFLQAIHEVTFKHLDETEWMWPLSIPGVLPEEKDILEAQLSAEDTAYREYLSSKYGKYKQMVSGIHYNFGLPSAFFELVKEDGETTEEVRNRVYMKLARQFIRYQWLLIYLYGASPIAPQEYFGKEDALDRPVKSLRTSRYGYVNDSSIQVSFNSIDAYIQTLRHYVDTKQLIAEKEFYSSVRFRGAKSVVEFLEKGIQYMEFRLFDLNPFALEGIALEDVRFVHLFLMLMLWLDEVDYIQSVKIGQDYTQAISLIHPLDSAPYQSEGEWLLQQLLEMADTLSLSRSDKELIQQKIEQLQDPKKTIGGRLWQLFEKENDMVKIGMSLAKQHKDYVMERPYGLRAFEDMELSTQVFIHDAIQAGVHVEILDSRDQFLKLTYKGQVEYVKNGNMTSHDTYISPLMMENKVVTKKVLAQAGFKVPASLQCQSLDEAAILFHQVQNKPIVIKPKSTNYGLGITIFQEGIDDKETFLEAIKLALKEDKEVMIEDFIQGTEYRFFVLNGETRAVLLRVGANVIGDGIHTIAELVAQKNDNPLRGDGKTTPLKKIELGDIEKIQLQEQGYTTESVVETGVQVFLRANSNISTGGDSIDVTDEMHDSYKQIAADIAKAMYAKVCGVDLIVPDKAVSAAHRHDSYGIIEANFNPMMMMHIYPAVGTSRRLTHDILRMLFPEIELPGEIK